MKKNLLVIIFIVIGYANIFPQGISIGVWADIDLDAADGASFPYKQNIEFNLGEVKGSFSISLGAYFTDTEDIPYLGRFQGLITVYRSTTPTNNDYRHVAENEVLQLSLSDINISEGSAIFLEGLSGRMLEGDTIEVVTGKGDTRRIIGETDADNYYRFAKEITLTESDTVTIHTISGRWRLNSLSFFFITGKDLYDPFSFISTDDYYLSTFPVSSFGRYYLEGDHTTGSHPQGISVVVIDEQGDTVRIKGRHTPSAIQYRIDLGILRAGDQLSVLMGTMPGDPTDGWPVSLIQKPFYHGSFYTDPIELPIAKASPIEQLEIFKYGHPRVFSFRNDYLGQWEYNTFYTTVVQTQGAAPKCLAEERIPSQQNLPKMQQFAKEYPEKVILNHFSFDGQMLNYIPESYDFFSKEHWCYYPGTYLTKSLSKDDSIVNVITASRFQAPNNDGTAFKNDVVILIPLDSLGNKIWENAEYAAIKEINENSLTLLRALFGTEKTDFQEGTYIAPTFTHSGWNLGHDLQGYRGDETYFFYNWSAFCPLDSLGRNCSDAFVEFYENFLKKGGKFERFHGVMADVWRGNNGGRPLYKSEIYSRNIDHNVDGKADDGFDERGYNMIAYGQHDFARKFRKMLGPDRIWTADGNGSQWPRAVPFLSGIESEGFDSHHDAFLKGWSGAINRFSYYRNNLSQENQFNVAVPKILDYEEEFPENEKTHHLLRRLARAATTILELNNCANGVRTGEWTPFFWLADDYVKGVEEIAQWLGDPVGEIIRPAKDSSDLLNGTGQNMSPSFVNKWSSTDVDIYTEGQILCIEGKKEGLGLTQERMTVQYPMNIPEGDLFIRFMVKADSLHAFSADFPRYFFVTLNGLQSTEWTWKTLEGMAGSHGYEEMSFYYRHAGPANVNIEIEFEGYEKVWIKDFTIHNAPDVMAREFENGIVLVNPSADPFLFDLDQLFPGKSLRFIEGHEYEDFLGINNGKSVQGPVLLNHHRGTFLIKEKNETSIMTDEALFSGTKIYPVPSRNQLNIVLFAREDGEYRISLHDIQGKTVFSKNEYVSSGENHMKIQSMDLNGLYFLTLINGDKCFSRKVIFLDE